MPHPHEMIDIWSVEGRFQQLVYSPKGGVEGVLIATDGVPTQFVTDPQDASIAGVLCKLRPGQALVIEGSDHGPSPKGESEHFVYRFERLVSIDGKPVKPAEPANDTRGTVVRFNYAKHGAPNGVVLDNGDFVHTRPEGFVTLAAKIGDRVRAEGQARALTTGTGRVIEATSVMVEPTGPAH